ncbi:hypothetical protein GCM10029976_094340 [Kribbella albertanoniae]|uniref:hypothetical protein n=1 Tax=Kribbella albertanoniae TaxID=1266829 RepID=UPI00140500E5|nr:hypothetical protein [Kribbella albertanoniae]
MPNVVQVFRAKIDPENVAHLLQVRPAAIAQAQAACQALVRAELVRLDDDVWLDILIWSEPDGPEQLMKHAAELPLLAEMHSLVGEMLWAESGELAHSTQL